MPDAGKDPSPMNFSKLSKEKRNQLILVVLITLGTVAGLGLGLGKYQKENLVRLAERKAVAEKKLAQMEDAVKHSTRIQSDLTEAKQTLPKLDSILPPSPSLVFIRS